MAEGAGVSSDARAAALVAVIAVAPLAIVLVIALIRGYTIHVSAYRGKTGRRGRVDDDE